METAQLQMPCNLNARLLDPTVTPLLTLLCRRAVCPCSSTAGSESYLHVNRRWKQSKRWFWARRPSLAFVYILGPCNGNKMSEDFLSPGFCCFCRLVSPYASNLKTNCSDEHFMNKWCAVFSSVSVAALKVGAQGKGGPPSSPPLQLNQNGRMSRIRTLWSAPCHALRCSPHLGHGVPCAQPPPRTRRAAADAAAWTAHGERWRAGSRH